MLSARRPSRPDQAIEQRPCQDEAHHSRHNIAGPEIAKGAVEVALGIAFGPEEENERRDDARTQQVEGKARVGFEAEGAGDDAEEGGGDITDVGDDLKEASVSDCILLPSVE